MMSGRWSPINSPARSGRAKTQHSPKSTCDSKSVLYKEDDNGDNIPPPSYNGRADDKSTFSRGSHTSDAYSNLLNFLDGAAGSAKAPTEHADDISTISNSISSPQKHRAFGSKKYVWDEIPENVASFACAQESDTLTYFKAPSHSLEADSHSIGTTSTLQTNIEEVKSKVDAMKAELKSRQQHAKGLQSELARLKVATQRKGDKAKSTWQKKLQTLREENAAAIKRQSDFTAKVMGDVSKLEAKLSTLSEQSEHFEQSAAQRVQAAQEEGARNKRRSRKQMEADERQVFEKIAGSKRQAMQKSAADSVGPRLEELVKSNRERINKLREEGEVALVRKTNELRRELQSQLETSVKLLRERSEAEESSSAAMSQRRLEEVANRHVDEITALKQRFSREKALADDNYERSRRINTDHVMDQAARLKDSEKETLSDLVKKQQRELNSVIAIHMEEFERLRVELASDLDEWKDIMRKQMELQSAAQEEDLRERLKMDMSAEMEDIRSKLREDAARKRADMKASCEEEVREARMTVSEQLEGLQSNTDRNQELMMGLSEEVDHLQQRLFSQKRNISALKTDLDEQMKNLRLASIGTDGGVDGGGEDDGLSVSPSSLAERQRDLDDQLAHRRQELEDDAADLQEAAARDRVALEELREQHAEQLTCRREEMADEVARIEDKISALLKHRESVCADMRAMLADLRGRNAGLEEELDEHRSKKIAS